MKKEKWVSIVCLIVFTLCVCFSVLGLSYRQMVLTITIPDGNTSGMHHMELIVPEGAVAMNFTVWGVVDSWGINSENAGISGESLFVYYPDEYLDSESSESVDTGGDTVGHGYDYDSELSRLELPPGTYVVWVKGEAGTTITVQYLLEER